MTETPKFEESGLTANDVSQLEVLPLLFTIMGFLTFCGSSLFIMHFIMGLTLFFDPQAFGPIDGPKGSKPLPPFIALGMAGMGAFAVLAGWLLSAGCFLASGWIKRREMFSWITVVSAVLCMITPFGTALGVFTLVVLNRAQVKAVFTK
jgi:hypothetical protein